MHYMTMSFTHKNTDIGIREQLSFASQEKLRDMLCRIVIHPSLNEAIILSTCNRVEIITSAKECKEALAHITSQLVEVCKVDKEDILGRVDVYEDNGAIHHLFAVASSLDSLVIGETQIVGQLKDAYRFAYEEGFCGLKLSRAMHHAFRCAALVRSQTSISQSPISVSSVAVSKAEEIAGSLEGKEVLVIGAGEMSTLAVKHLLAHKAKVVLINRTPANAYALAASVEGDVRVDDFSFLGEYVNRFSFIFSATGASKPIVTDGILSYQEHPRYFFDIAVPRDIELSPRANVQVFAVDDLKEIVSRNVSLREEQAQVAYGIVGRSTIEFFRWLQTLSVDPIIKEIREKAKNCAMQEVAKAAKKGYIPKESEEAVMRVVHQVFNAFLHRPTKNLKAIAEQPESDTIVQAIQYFFDINEEENKQLDHYQCDYQLEKHA